MKIQISMKTPDAVEYAINQAVESEDLTRDCDGKEAMDEDERYEFEENLRETCKKWFRYGECVSIEIDTETGEATVLESK